MKEKIGQIWIDHGNLPKRKQPNGVKYLRRLVDWINSRPEHMNEGKSHLSLIAEYNEHRRKIENDQRPDKR